MELKELLTELENEIQLKTENNSFINQPSIISVSSDNAQKQFNNKNDSFYSFTVNLKRPALQVKSIQLLQANIPQCKGYNFDDTELIFPYYRLRTQDNIANETYYTENPTLNTLYYIRLLPSYYPPELIPNAQLYGFNKTFNNYEELSNELQKATSNDLLYTNIQNTHFIPNDISITYNTTYNKFQMKGNTTTWTPNTWSGSTTYSINNLVMYNNQVWISLTNNNQSTPGVSQWQLYTGSTTYTYLIAGYDDPNVLQLQENINQLINNENPDFFYGQYNLPSIVSIPSQPYKQGKTLAKRLGFTWNGSGLNQVFPINNTVSQINYVEGSSLPIFFNRLRPVPQYEIIPPELGSPPPNNNPYTQYTYIADNFCNLVYSSIINIYTNIIASGTIDQTNRSLLSIIPLNCAPLGITFTNNFIDNPITKINKDIYQISIEMRNEIDEPYFISNNGIVSFMLKLTY